MSYPQISAGEAAVAERIDAAHNGSTVAMTELAGALLMGQDGLQQDLNKGVGWLERAANLGDADALERMATITAVGVIVPPAWPAALDLLQRAAERGSTSAQGQIRLLSKAGQDESRTWSELRATIDVADWMTAPPRKPLAETPRIRLSENFAPAALCDWLIARARGRLRPGLMYDGVTKTAQVDPHRTCSDYQFDILNADLIVQLVREKISAVTRLPTAFMEPPRIFHYATGEDIKAHFDRASDGVNGYGGGDYHGDRIVTFLLYLNDGYDGGDLSVPRVGFLCKGAKGDGIYFCPCRCIRKTRTQAACMLGLTVTSGEKWVMSQWIHDRPFQAAVSDV